MASVPRLDDLDGGDAGRKGRKDANAVDLDWQSFPTAESSAMQAPPSEVEVQKTAAVAGGPGVNLQVHDAAASPLAFCTPSFYQHMFDIDTSEVVERLKAAAWPLSRSSFLTTIGSKPDFYGPVWVAATLVFVIGAGSNLSSWLSFKPGTEAVSIWHYDFRLVTFALLAVYTFAFGVSTALWFAFQFLGIMTGMPLIYMLCVYGYSLTVFVPAALLSIIPSTALQWTVAVVAAALSALHVFKSLFPVLAPTATSPTSAGSSASSSPIAVHFNSVGMKVVVPTVIVVQLGFAALLKMEFFTF